MSYLAKEKFHLRASNEMILARMVGSFGFAMVATIMSIYLSDAGLSDSQVGYLTGGASVAMIAVSFMMPMVLERHNELKIYIYSTVALGLAWFILGNTKAIVVIVLIIFASRILIAARDNAANIVFRDIAKNKTEFTAAQGLAGSLGNFSWFVGPILGGLALSQIGITSTFALASLFMMMSAALFVIMPIKLKRKERTKIDSNWIENTKFYLSRPTLLIAYAQRMGVTMWWSYVWTFIPLFMITNGYTATDVGFVVGVTQLPLFLLEFWTVKQVKTVGYRTIFVFSYGLLAAIMAVSFAVNSLAAIIILIMAGSFALAFLEPIVEIYFFDQVTKLEEEKTYPTFNTANSVGSILGKLLIGASIGLFGSRSSYLVMAILLVLIAMIAMQIKPRSGLQTPKAVLHK